MKLVELKLTLDSNGDLNIPAEIMEQMKIKAGNVYVSYLSDDGEKNKYRELFLAPKCMEEIDAEPNIQIAHELLQQAGISNTDDLQVVCIDGAVILCKDLLLTVDELEEIANRLGLAVDLAEQAGDSSTIAVEKLEELCDEFESEGE